MNIDKRKKNPLVKHYIIFIKEFNKNTCSIQVKE
ncbi:hypothetical protein protein [Bacillus cereus G9241]|nr:hypothetical protein protein [Bacillus cereus G9241]